MSEAVQLMTSAAPVKLTTGYTVGGNGLFSSVNSTASAFMSTGYAQRVDSTPHTSTIQRYLDPAVGQLSEKGDGFQDPSVNHAEFQQGVTTMIKRFPEGYEETYKAGTDLFMSVVDPGTAFSVPVFNILQNKRTMLLNTTSMNELERQRFAIGNSDAALRAAREMMAGTNALLELTAKDPNDFANKCNWLGSIIGREPYTGDMSVEPVFSVTTPNIGERTVINCFGSPCDEDICYYIVKDYPLEGAFERNTNFIGKAVSNMATQIRGFCSSTSPSVISGEDGTPTEGDIMAISEKKAAADFIDYKWDDETQTIKPFRPTTLTDEGWQAVLQSMSEIQYNAYTSGKVIPVGMYKGRVQVVADRDAQILATTSINCYNTLGSITLRNLQGRVRS